MLVLSRRAGESIIIADSITVTILEVRGNRAKLGIIAPVETPIHRGEVHEKISHSQPVDRSRRDSLELGDVVAIFACRRTLTAAG